MKLVTGHFACTPRKLYDSFFVELENLKNERLSSAASIRGASRSYSTATTTRKPSDAAVYLRTSLPLRMPVRTREKRARKGTTTAAILYRGAGGTLPQSLYPEGKFEDEPGANRKIQCFRINGSATPRQRTAWSGRARICGDSRSMHAREAAARSLSRPPHHAHHGR